MNQELYDRITDAVIDADFEFWSIITAAFPEANLGEFDTIDTVVFERAQRDAVLSWLMSNTELFKEEIR